MSSWTIDHLYQTEITGKNRLYFRLILGKRSVELKYPRIREPHKERNDIPALCTDSWDAWNQQRWLVGCKGDVIADASFPVRLSTSYYFALQFNLYGIAKGRLLSTRSKRGACNCFDCWNWLIMPFYPSVGVERCSSEVDWDSNTFSQYAVDIPPRAFPVLLYRTQANGLEGMCVGNAAAISDTVWISQTTFSISLSFNQDF